MLEIRNLHVRYGSIIALRGISLSVGRGEIVSVVGPNGAGKSSLMLSLTGIVRSEGEILLDGQSLSGLPPEAIAESGLSLVPEDRGIFSSLTVRENLSLGGTLARARADFDRRLDEVFELFPILSERLHGSAGKLSGGEQQQLAIGRALMSLPRLLLLDEPSLGLAPVVIDRVYDAITLLRQKGLSILVVEQNAERALSVSDRTFVLSTGSVVMSGPSEQLRDDPNFREAYFGNLTVEAV
ncbi:ABC transporter ATP-binding protein [Kaistia sp. MMO-174]|uniref:ABC transporter ATP-binding protein n=1 Tax=Kaistia sp. MMO-174 TaxID=3081256 RepID=UPI003019F88D